MKSKVLLGSVLALSLAVFSTPSRAELVPGDKTYYIQQDDHYRYIFSEDHAALMPVILQWNLWFLQKYQESFQWKFDEKAQLIIASGNNQIANGYATVIPMLKTVFYPAGVLVQDDFAISSWFKVLMVHETAHLYQLNVKSDLSRTLKYVFGNSLVVQTPLIVPVFIHPNVFLPTFLVEGNAVMNESKWGIGGRLYSGQIKALSYAQALERRLDASRLLNDHLDFPFGQEKYYQGGYFFQYLAEKYGVDRVNLFFKHQAEHFIVPLNIYDTFLKTFGASYNQLLREYSRDLEIKAQGQRKIETQSFAQAEFYSDLNHDKDEIYFLTQLKGKSYPLLWQIDKTNASTKSQPIDLASGKVFKTDKGWASVTSRRESVDRLEYGLFREGLYPLKDHWGWAVSDLRAGHSLSFEPTRSFFQGQLYKNGNYLGPADSIALLDENGAAYYFIQKGETRELYKDNQKLFEYTGYYGKLMEIDLDGRIYFVASTEKGSSLFVWNPMEEGFKEALASDRVVGARRISDNKVLAVEVSAEGYEYKIAEIKIRDAKPFFERNPLEEDIDFSPLESGQLGLDPKSKTYRYLSQIKYSSLDYFYSSDENGDFMGGLFAHFTDPLEWNALNLTYIRDSSLRDNAIFSYSNRRYPLGFQFHYLYEEDAYLLFSEGAKTRLKEPTNSAILNFDYPLFFQGRWSSTWYGQLLWEREDHPTIKTEDHLAAKNSLSFDWAVNYPMAYQSFRFFNINVSHQTEVNREPFKKIDDIYSVSTYGSYDIYDELYFTTSYAAGFSHNKNIRLDNSFLPQAISDDYYSLGVSREFRMNQIQIWEAELKKAINSSYYFDRFPLSLRRWAPFISARHYETKDSSSLLKRAFWEYEFGAEIELLLIHRIPIRTEFSGFSSSPRTFNAEGTSHNGWLLRVGTVQEF